MTTFVSARRIVVVCSSWRYLPTMSTVVQFSSSAKVRRCALVSTAGSLLGTMYGREIDAHEDVIRVGQGPSGGRYQKDVGSRTTLRIARRTLFAETEHNDLHMLGTVLRSEGWPRSVYMHFTCPGPVPAVAELITCVPVPRCSMKLGSNPTTGLASVMLLLGERDKSLPAWWPRCDSLKLYGFGETNGSAAYHYWSDGSHSDGQNSSAWDKRKENTGKLAHDYGSEHSLLRAKLGNTSSLDGPFVISRAAVTGWCAAHGQGSRARQRRRVSDTA